MRTLVLLLCLGAALPAAAGESRRFPHAAHLDFVMGDSARRTPLPPEVARRLEGLGEGRVLAYRCDTCHVLPVAPGKPAALHAEACEPCHDGTPAFRRSPPAPPPPVGRVEVRFPHESHAGGALPCIDCHRDASPDRELSTSADCLGCHARRQVRAVTCQRCHAADLRAVRPAGHGADWRARHGQASELGDEARHGKGCRDCHGSDACGRCHRLSAPRDHTGLWRVRLHGTAASWDRDRCRVCHETGVCVRCHSTTAPSNHTGAWRSIHMLAAVSTSNESCMACHRAFFCADCHRQGR
jgi:ribosomal protein L40E